MHILIKLLFLFLFTNLFSKELITPIPENIEHNKQMASLGKKLFFDKKLSYDNTVSCASCHIISEGGDDNSNTSNGANFASGVRNSPTVLNTVFNTSQFWDGRAKNLIEQAPGPIHNPIEMNSNFYEIIKKLNKDKEYKKEFKKVFNEKINEQNIIKAIVEFEKSLITPNSKFDQFLKGNKKALNDDEIKGYNTFKDYGCISCHNGVNVGGNIIQKIGIMKDFKSKDLGRYQITKKESDKYFFKVPSLRNIDLTAPYFHDGSVQTLEKAVELMAQYQIGFPLKEKEIKNIVKFLKTLTGEIPKIEQ